MSKIKIVDFFSSSPSSSSYKSIHNKECYICYEEVNECCFKKLNCKHELCQDCYVKLPNEKCPFCRQTIREKIIELIEDPEEWILFDANEWITYSRTLRDGREVIYTYHSSEEQPSWRNDDNVMIMRRHRQRKRRRRHNTF